MTCSCSVLILYSSAFFFAACIFVHWHFNVLWIWKSWWRSHINRLGTHPQNGAAAWRQLVVQQTICTPQKKRLVFTGTLSIVMKFCIPIFKKGDRRNPKNYRGISIINTCFKRYSKMLHMKLQNYWENLWQKHKTFWEGHLCTDAAFCLTLLIEK